MDKGTETAKRPEQARSNATEFTNVLSKPRRRPFDHPTDRTSDNAYSWTAAAVGCRASGDRFARNAASVCRRPSG